MLISRRGITLLSQLAIDSDLGMGAHSITLGAGQLVDGKDVGEMLKTLDPDEDGKILPAQLLEILGVEASNDNIHSDAAEVTKNCANSVYVEFKSYTLTIEGMYGANATLRIIWDVRNEYGGVMPAISRVKRNGVFVGTEQSSEIPATSEVTESEDIAGWSNGDVLSIWGSQTGAAANVRINDVFIRGKFKLRSLSAT